MFARETFVLVSAFDADGRTLPLDSSDWMVGRPELGWHEVLPEAICRTRTDVVRVTVTDQGGTRSITCR